MTRPTTPTTTHTRFASSPIKSAMSTGAQTVPVQSETASNTSASNTSASNTSASNTATSSEGPGRANTGATFSPITRALVACGIAAGPVFVVAGFTHALLRPGFDLSRHAMSMLALGETGWIQTASFLLSGVLTLLWAAGLRRTLPSRWIPRSLALLGVGLIAAAMFPADPGFGFPEGAPAGMPEVTTTGALHAVAFGIAMLGWISAAVLLTRYFARTRQRGWMVLSAIGMAVLLVPLPMMGATMVLYASSTLTWAWTTAVAVRFYRS